MSEEFMSCPCDFSVDIYTTEWKHYKSRLITRRALSHAASYSASRRLSRSLIGELPIQTRCQQRRGLYSFIQ